MIKRAYPTRKEPTKLCLKSEKIRRLCEEQTDHCILLSKTDAPVKLTDSEAAKLEEILDNAREKFEKILNKEIADHIEPGCAHSIHLTIPHVSME